MRVDHKKIKKLISLTFISSLVVAFFVMLTNRNIGGYAFFLLADLYVNPLNRSDIASVFLIMVLPICIYPVLCSTVSEDFTSTCSLVMPRTRSRAKHYNDKFIRLIVMSLITSLIHAACFCLFGVIYRYELRYIMSICQHVIMDFLWILFFFLTVNVLSLYISVERSGLLVTLIQLTGLIIPGYLPEAAGRMMIRLSPTTQGIYLLHSNIVRTYSDLGIFSESVENFSLEYSIIYLSITVAVLYIWGRIRVSNMDLLR